MTSRRIGKFRCVACGRVAEQPIDEDHPRHEIRSWCCGCAYERALVNKPLYDPSGEKGQK